MLKVQEITHITNMDYHRWLQMPKVGVTLCIEIFGAGMNHYWLCKGSRSTKNFIITELPGGGIRTFSRHTGIANGGLARLIPMTAERHEELERKRIIKFLFNHSFATMPIDDLQEIEWIVRNSLKPDAIT